MGICRLVFLSLSLLFVSQGISQTFNYDVFVGERLNFSIPKSHPTDYFNLDSQPKGAKFDTVSGLFQWIPKTEEVGFHTIAYHVLNKEGEIVQTNRFSVHVIIKYSNDAPKISINTCFINNRKLTVFSSSEIHIKERDTLSIRFEILDTDDVFTSYYFNGDLNMKIIPNAEVRIKENYKHVELIFVPNENDAGNKNVFFHLVTRDDAGATASRSIKIVVKNVNFPPKIINKPLNEKYIFDDCNYTFIPKIENDDDNKLSWMFQCDNSLQEFVVFNNRTGEVAININRNKVLADSINYTFTLKVKEENEEFFSDSVVVVCKWQKSNQPPTIKNLQTWEVKEGVESGLQIEAEDPNVNDKIVYRITSVNLPGIYINENTGYIRFTPDFALVNHIENSKEFKAYVTVTDNKGLNTTELLTIKVFDRYDPSNIKSKYFAYKKSLIELESRCDEMNKTLNEIARFLDTREKRFNYVLSGMTILGAAGVLFADGSTGKNFATIVAAIPAGIKVYKEINKKTDDQTEDLIDDVVKQQSILSYRLNDLESRFTSNPTEKEFDDPENIGYIIYMTNNELPAQQSSFYYVQNQFEQLLGAGKHKKVYEKITYRKLGKAEKAKLQQRNDQNKYREQAD